MQPDDAPAGTFATDTAIHPTGDGRYAGRIVDGWDIGGNANGGYLLAILGRALREASGRPDVVIMTAHYLSPGRPGDVTIDALQLKSGRQFTTVTGGMRSGDALVLHATGAFGDLSSSETGIRRLDGTPPPLPSPDDCPRAHPAATAAPPVMGRFDLRLHPEDVGFLQGQPHGKGLVRGWFRLLDDEPMDTVALLLAIDAFPPTAFNAALPVAWTPTVELTVHLRARPVPGWLRCEFTTRFVSGGFLEEDGTVWDESGQLVAQSRQLALVPRAG